MVGGSAEGRRGGAPVEVSAFPARGVTAVAAPATATRNLRRLTSGRGCFRAIGVFPLILMRGGLRPTPGLNRAHEGILSPQPFYSPEAPLAEITWNKQR